MINTVVWYQNKIPRPPAQAWVQFGILLLDSCGQKGKSNLTQNGWETRAVVENMNNKMLAKKPPKYQRVSPELQATLEFRLRVTIYIPNQMDRTRPIKFTISAGEYAKLATQVTNILGEG